MTKEEKKAYMNMWLLLDCLQQEACPEDENNNKTTKCKLSNTFSCFDCYKEQAKKLIEQTPDISTTEEVTLCWIEKIKTWCNTTLLMCKEARQPTAKALAENILEIINQIEGENI